MNDHQSLHVLEELLSQACEALGDAARDTASISDAQRARFRRHIAEAILHSHEARSLIYLQAPELKPERERQAELDPAGNEAYQKASLHALHLASAGNQEEALSVLEGFAAATSNPYFAGLAKMQIEHIRGGAT